ncbi:MAG: DMT family transporter [Acidobacteriota bacterium]
MHSRAILAMLAAAVLFSTAGLAIKKVSLSGFEVAFWRSLFAAVTMLLLTPVLRRPLTLRLRKRAWIGVVAYALTLLLFVLATKKTTAANATFLQYTAPFYILVLEPRLLGTRFRSRDLGFVVVAFAAMGLFFVDDLGGGSWIGNVLALASGLTLAMMVLAMRSSQDNLSERWCAALFGNLLLAAPLLVLVPLGFTSIPQSADDWLGLLFLGIFQIGFAYVFYTYALGWVTALEASLLSMLEPLLNPVWVYLGTGERPGRWALVGGAVILGAILLRVVTGPTRERQ